ncbi:MAG: glutamine synthetase III [Spirochaetales bacterium]|nr:glutamine synthetase III [Spirochaetales bacterium]
METVTDYFGSLVFNDAVMREKLPKDIYKTLRQTVSEGRDIDLAVANSVANAMKVWALEHGCTHYTHWFQPMTGITAEKHEAFVSPAEGGRAILEFSGKALIKGEADGSSFPSGGLRATFEARGYTAWDPTSYAFIREDTLYIPTVFCSYTGEVLDKKTPLLRSMEAVSDEAVKILHLFGDEDVRRVITTVGPEQEYFLINRSDFERRKDLVYTGRTLFGARAPKGQEKDDHYYGAIKTRVAEYMRDLDKELWKLGVSAKTRHNEVAPCQHELATVYATANIAVDHNQIVMDMMKKVAERHGFVCLLHEKPFAGVNGSGKHNNWSISTDTGRNLLDPGKNPRSNLRFLLFLAAVIKAVDEYQDLLRVSVASAGNDHRLGANEAPPAIVSMFLGDDLTQILESIASGKDAGKSAKESMELGVHVLPSFSKDTTDRNRTSPFAFTGNKFEFRTLGSSFSVAGPNFVLNTIVAKELRLFYSVLKDAADFESAVLNLVRDTYNAHNRIVFNGNNYSAEWVKEAERRGLMNLRSTPDALDSFVAPKNIALFSEFGVFSSVEMNSRFEILNEEYSKTIHIEALTMHDMIVQQILPATTFYATSLAQAINQKKTAMPELKCSTESNLLSKVSELTDELSEKTAALDSAVEKGAGYSGAELAHYSRKNIVPAMEEARKIADELELLVGTHYWPFPTYGDILFYVN